MKLDKFKLEIKIHFLNHNRIKQLLKGCNRMPEARAHHQRQSSSASSHNHRWNEGWLGESSWALGSSVLEQEAGKGCGIVEDTMSSRLEVSGGRAANSCIPMTTSYFFLHPQVTSYSPTSPKFCSCPLFPYSLDADLQAAPSSTCSSPARQCLQCGGEASGSESCWEFGLETLETGGEEGVCCQGWAGGTATVATVRGSLPDQSWKNQKAEKIRCLAWRFSLLLSLRCNI